MIETSEYGGMRHTWSDYNERQKFEHELINRKTSWSLTSQSILFAAYGVSMNAVDKSFQHVVAVAGLAVSVVSMVGVIAVIRSKLISWKSYDEYYRRHKLLLPEPLPKDGSLPWGVNTRNTYLTLVPDVLLPVIFIIAWCQLRWNLPF